MIAAPVKTIKMNLRMTCLNVACAPPSHHALPALNSA